ncbi:hypothetical protein GN244_ATG17424 [Phytophthora infestans]|uniref:M96 mating-specific protein family n=1 Tax=Phytophthora infestans TaxID=4787 RepID=A0A833S1S5_PHYIN|nr:hypothetical protein GN244_ATG17424 [Phytophthora infestans]KAF4135991.1 hypothetical protein GN958_ATG14818 [Phytophthora infestans]
MAFLQEEDNTGVFEAALSFVDECSVDCPGPCTRGLTPPAALELPSFKSEQYRAVLIGGPSFSIDCREAATMVPLNMKTLISGAIASEFRPSLPRCHEIMTQPNATKTKKVPANPNRVRDEVQYELAFLRQKVAELELQLNKMHLKTTSTGKVNAKASLPRPLMQVPLVWKEMAARQQRRREGAQRENVRLRLIVERKRKMATGLSALLRKRLTQQGAECLRGKGSHTTEQRTACVLDFQGDIGDFHDLFQHLQIAYHEIDSVFAASGLSTMDFPANDVHVREGVDGKYIEVFANKLLPFSLHKSGEAAWDHFKGVEKHFGNGGLYEKAAKVSMAATPFGIHCSVLPTDSSVSVFCVCFAQNLDQPYTIIEDFTKEMFSNNSRADVKAKQIVQRVVGVDRDMILFVSSVTPVEIKHKPIDGLVYHAREYALTKRFSTEEHDLSLLQLYVRISFDYDPGVVFDSRHVRSVAQFLIGNVAGSLRCYQERIENALIDQALRRLHV